MRWEKRENIIKNCQFRINENFREIEIIYRQRLLFPPYLNGGERLLLPVGVSNWACEGLVSAVSRRNNHLNNMIGILVLGMYSWSNEYKHYNHGSQISNTRIYRDDWDKLAHLLQIFPPHTFWRGPGPGGRSVLLRMEGWRQGGGGQLGGGPGAGGGVRVRGGRPHWRRLERCPPCPVSTMLMWPRPVIRSLDPNYLCS